MRKNKILILTSGLVLILMLLVSCNKVTYTLTYELNGGLIEGNNEYSVSVDEKDENKMVDVKTPVRTGYDFIGWYLNDELYEETTVLIDKNITLSAHWEIISYRIIYDADEGKITGKINEYTCEDEFDLPVPTKTGYTFLGWNDGMTKIVKGTTGKLNLKAKWELTKYSITYHLDGGTLKNSVVDFTYLDEIVLDKPTKEGYKFRGWYLNSDMSGPEIIRIEKGTTENVELFASWVSNSNVSNINYVLNGGSLSDDCNLEYEHGKEFELATPTKENYLFMGWYENKDLSGDSVEKIDSSASGEKTYYASWLSAKEVFNNLIPKNVTENLVFYDVHPDNKDIQIYWKSSDERTINKLGEIDQAHRNIDVNLTMMLVYKKSKVSYMGSVKVAPVVYDELVPGKFVAGYVYAGTLSRWGENSFEKIFTETALNTLDVVNYGFATVTGAGNLQLNNTGYTTYLEEVLKLRKHGIRVLLCIAENSANFSTMALTDAGIEKFVSQVIETVEKYHFDGVDIDWEFPGVDSGRDVTIDRPNYTKLIKALRKALDARQNKSGTPYLLTAAIPGTSWGSERYEMNVLDEYLDYVNMMSYDLNNTSMACHHTNLYTSNAAKAYGFSVQYGVDRFVSLGFDKNKIVAGMAFYGKYYTKTVALGVDAKFGKNIHYTVIKNNYLSNSDFVEYWDEVAKASYLFNKSTGEFISYDSVRSIKEKCNYAKTSGIMGVMFWDYSEDTTGDLIQAINEEINK